MTGPVPHCVDPAEAIITTVMSVMRAVFGPEGGGCPPVGGGSTVVHFVPGEGPAWDPLAGHVGEQTNDDPCQIPFLWVRLISRYRTTSFPDPTLINPCGGMPVINLELGVGRCVDMDVPVDWSTNAQEAEWGLDDSFRLDKTLCVLTGLLGDSAIVAAEPSIPAGPEGGGIVWTTSVFIGIVGGD